MLSAKQGGIKYHFLSLWYDSTRDWTPVSRAIVKHSSAEHVCVQQRDGNSDLTADNKKVHNPRYWACNLQQKVILGLVSLFNGISTLFRLFNAKAILQEEQLWYYLIHSWENKGVHTFPKGICLKVNVIVQLEYKLAYYDSTVHRFNHYTTRTSPK